ncbi:MAG: extracellular solute-binding protein [Proteobacteria bacterium]|nr:extracellular solute-binding protein [Pseudomonadota bacterium]
MRYLCVVMALVCGLLSQAFAGDFWQKAKAVFEGKKQQDSRVHLVLWHSFGGSLNYALDKIVNEYNQSQHKYYVEAINKSNYQNSLTAAATAYRSSTQPNMLVSYEIGTAMMIYSNGAIIPLYELEKMTGITIDQSDFWPAVSGYYSVDGKLAGLPFNSSSPVLFYNKKALAKAGVTHPPVTWQELTKVGEKLIQSGQGCVMTAAYPSWLLLEEFSAWNNLAFASANNGFDSMKPKLRFDNQTVADFLTQLKAWQAKGIFQYGGRLGSADTLFTSGKCAMIVHSSSMLADYSKLTTFKVGVAKIPFWQTKDTRKPQNTIIGGGAIWMFALPKNTPNADLIYKGVASFYQFLAQPKIQAQWAMDTGYVPATKSAYELMQKEGYYKKDPNALIAVESLNNAPPKPYTLGIRLGNFPLIRQENDSMLERIFSNQQSVDDALEDAVDKGNKLINQFYRQNKV